MTIAQSARPSSSPITVTLKRLVALLEEDETDEYGVLQPSQTAFKLAMRLTWSKLESDCEVRLVCPAHADQQAYLYHELGKDYAVEREVTVSILLQWLEWLNQA
jgi:hypothetical protein